MKKIERISYKTLFSGTDALASAITELANKANELIDSYNELLDTHTLKEECQHKKYTLSVSTRNGTRKICNNCGKDYRKE